jgi:hypothetical protein
MEDGGLSQPNLSRNRDEALSLLHPIDDDCESLLMAGTEIKEVRIRGDVERLPVKPVKL